MSEYNYNNEFKEAAEKVEQGKKKKSGKAKKFFGAVFLGLVFGCMASLAYTGTNKLLNHNKDKEVAIEESEKSDTPKIAEVTPEEKSESEKLLKNDIDEGIDGSINSVFSKESNDGALSVQDVVKESMPSIVAITNKSIQELRSFYGMGTQEYEAVSAGSGIIVGQNDTELLIVTNAHVIADADTLSVCCIDGEAYEAKVKGEDDENDIAVITVSLSDISGSTLNEIKVAKLGSSDDLEIGEQVVAIGNAMGYGQSVTTGIVSALNRTIDGSDDGQAFIQTDAAINPGNSGGALLNMKGEVVGINSAKLANTKIEGMGYAIPISAAGEIVDDLMNLVTRNKVDEADAGYLGISGFSVTDEVANAYNIPKGIYVSETTSGTAAERAGIQKGDVIVKFDGMSIDSINKLRERLDYYRAGETIDVIVARANDGEYQERTISVTLDGREGTPLDTGKSSDDSNDNSNDNNQEEQKDDGQRSGQFNFGGSTFQYSIPNDIFGIFGR